MDEIEVIKKALREVIELIVRRGEPLSQEIRIALVQAMEHVAEIISELRSQEPVEGYNPAPENPQLQASMPSSNIHSFGYDDKTNRLLVKFQGDFPQENGPIYSYDDVPKNIFELFRSGAIPARTNGKNKWGSWWKGKVPSIGASLFTLIKNGGYRYNKLS